MKRRFLVQDGQPALELIEEACALLRRVESPVWCAYLAGMLPFSAGLLYFWTDMGRGLAEEGHLALSTLALAGLFLAAKLGQTVLAEALLADAAGDAPPRWGVPRLGRAVLVHATLQPWGLFLLPLALVLTLPAGWTVAFFQNATVLAGSENATPIEVARRSWKAARTWPLQHAGILSILSGLGIFLFLNLLALTFLIPMLARMLTGVESVFTRTPWSVFSSTVLATLAMLTLVCLDPVFKAVFALRIFQSRALTTGDDIRAALRRWRTTQAGAAVLILLAMLTPLVGRGAASPSPAPAPGTVSPEGLDRSIDRTLSRREYQWRLPRDARPGATESADSTGWARFWRAIEKAVGEVFERATSAVDRFFTWLRGLFNRNPSASRPTRTAIDWGSPVEVLCYLGIGILAAACVVLAIRGWQERQLTAGRPSVETLATTAPNLDSEEVSASQLPEDGWRQLGQELLGRGEFRLALRAFYLAGLASLAARQLIVLARHKSNRDYQRELARRAHALPGLTGGFGETLEMFERVWYGNHPVDAAGVADFATRIQRLAPAPP
jgi:hypothetical protein